MKGEHAVVDYLRKTPCRVVSLEGVFLPGDQLILVRERALAGIRLKKFRDVSGE